MLLWKVALIYKDLIDNLIGVKCSDIFKDIHSVYIIVSISSDNINFLQVILVNYWTSWSGLCGTFQHLGLLSATRRRRGKLVSQVQEEEWETSKPGTGGGVGG